MTRKRTPPNTSDSLEFSVEKGVAYPLYPILVVDDEPENLQAFKLNFQGEFTIHTAESGAQALEMLTEREYAVIVSDQRMPGMTGIELLHKTVADYPLLVRIVLTGFTDHSSLIDAINYARIYQYITKPWKAEELSITLRRAIERYAVEVHNKRLTEALRRSKEEVEEQLRRSMRDLKRANERLRKLATSDGLTGLYNHRYFQERWRREIKRARRYHEPLSLMIIDVDHFKTYNDTLGHPQGDALLKEMANLLVSSVREVDLVARYGGDEFVIVLPKAPKNAALALGERIRSRVANHEFPNRSVLPRGHLSTSIGVATFPEDGSGPSEVIQAADDGLYVAKKAGRNMVAGPPEREKESPPLDESEESRRKREAAAAMAAEAARKEAEAAEAARKAASAAREAAEAVRKAADAAREAALAAESESQATGRRRKARPSAPATPALAADDPPEAEALAEAPAEPAPEPEPKPTPGRRRSKAGGPPAKPKRKRKTTKAGAMAPRKPKQAVAEAPEPAAAPVEEATEIDAAPAAEAKPKTAAEKRRARKKAAEAKSKPADATFEGDSQGPAGRIRQQVDKLARLDQQAADLLEPESLDADRSDGEDPFFPGAMNLGRDGSLADESADFSIDILSADGMASVDIQGRTSDSDSVVTQRRIAVLDDSWDDDDKTQPLLRPRRDPDPDLDDSAPGLPVRRHNVAGAPEAFEEVELAVDGDPDAETSMPPTPPAALRPRLRDAGGPVPGDAVQGDGMGGIVVSRGGDPDDDEGEPAADARRRHRVAQADESELVVARGDEDDPEQPGPDRSMDEEFVLAIED